MDILKDFKKLIVILAGVLCIIIAAVLLLSPKESGKGEDGGAVVVASQRVKIDLKRFETPEEPAKATPASTAGTDQATPAPAPAPTVKSTPKPEAPKPAPKAAPKAVAPKPAPQKKVPAGTWAINVASFTQKAPAERLKKSLESAGFNAYTTEFVKDGTRWNRVRVGFFSSRAEAEKAAREVKQKSSISQTPWVVKPPSTEVREHAG